MTFISDFTQLQKQIREFQKTDKRLLDESEISSKLMADLCINHQFQLPQVFTQFLAGGHLYRARKLESSDMNEIKKWLISDFWEVPAANVQKYGRLNHPKQSIFYTSNDVMNTVQEIRAQLGEKIVISCFEVKDDFKSVIICPSIDEAPNMSDEEKAFANLRIDFLRNEFTREVAGGLEYLYKTSNVIITDYFDLPDQVSSAWTYPAIGNKKSLNIAFRPQKAHEFLRFKGFLIGEVLLNDGVKSLDNIVVVNEKFIPVEEPQNILKNLYSLI